jgi:hypothetical protein
LGVIGFTSSIRRPATWFDGKAREAGRLTPFFFDGDTPYLFTRLNFGLDSAHGCPNPPNVLFRYVDRKWEQVPLAEAPIKKMTSNMTRDPKRVRKEIEQNNRKLWAEATIRINLLDFGRTVEVDLTSFKERTFACPRVKKYELK